MPQAQNREGSECLESSGKPDAWKLARPVWGWGRGANPRPTPPGLLPAGLFGKLLENAKANPAILPRRLEALFAAMARGGDFGADAIAWFNGGLFADADAIPLTAQEINTLAEINKYDWASVEPSIFGTLFERSLDPDKRSQIGAHYTSRGDIETLLRPVLMAPLQCEWAEVKRKCEEELWPKVVQSSRSRTRSGGKESPQRKAFDRTVLDFIERLAHVTVLDAACGSGNFLYVAINMLLDLEKEVVTYAAMRGLSIVPHVSPTQLHGLEINPYAHELAQVVIWIGYLQWMHFNGFKMPDHPVLTPIETIKQMDAILDLSDPEHPKEPEWPDAEFIVGNPPFLGGKLLRKNLGDEYVDTMFNLWGDRVPREADLCCYWFEKARRQIEIGKCRRTGLLATQGIRGGANRKVLERIKASGDVFFAESDRDWVLDGATVHVSMVGFDDGAQADRILNGKAVACIHANLRATANTTTAKPLAVNLGRSFMGDTKGGAFDIPEAVAVAMLCAPTLTVAQTPTWLYRGSTGWTWPAALAVCGSSTLAWGCPKKMPVATNGHLGTSSAMCGQSVRRTNGKRTGSDGGYTSRPGQRCGLHSHGSTVSWRH